MDEKEIISAAAGSQIQVAGVNNYQANYNNNSAVFGSQMQLPGANNYQPNYNPNSAAFGSQIQLATVYDYQRASTDPNNTEMKTALCAVPDVVSEQIANLQIGIDNFAAWGQSKLGNDEIKQQYLDDAEKCEQDKKNNHNYLKSFAPDKDLFEAKVKEGMLLTDAAMLANLGKDVAVLSVKGVRLFKSLKVTGKIPKNIEELREMIMGYFRKGTDKPNFDFIDGNTRLNGKLYGEERLDQLSKYLEKRNIKLLVGDEYLPPGAAGGFDANVGVLALRSNPTEYEVWHELSHYLQYKQLGKEAYLNLPRCGRTYDINQFNAPEQFVYDNFTNTKRWNMINEEERAHANWYINEYGGLR